MFHRSKRTSNMRKSRWWRNCNLSLLTLWRSLKEKPDCRRSSHSQRTCQCWWHPPLSPPEGFPYLVHNTLTDRTYRNQYYYKNRRNDTHIVFIGCIYLIKNTVKIVQPAIWESEFSGAIWCLIITITEINYRNNFKIHWYRIDLNYSKLYTPFWTNFKNTTRVMNCFLTHFGTQNRHRHTYLLDTLLHTFHISVFLVHLVRQWWLPC